jgi:hypothetical protein
VTKLLILVILPLAAIAQVGVFVIAHRSSPAGRRWLHDHWVWYLVAAVVFLTIDVSLVLLLGLWDGTDIGTAAIFFALLAYSLGGALLYAISQVMARRRSPPATATWSTTSRKVRAWVALALAMTLVVWLWAAATLDISGSR